MKFCSLVSGSSGNAVLVSDDRTNLLIDSGLNGKRTAQSLGEIGLEASDIDAILVTHEHSDHISGVGVLSRRYHIPVYANEATWDAMACTLGRMDSECVKIFETGCEFEIGSIGVRAFSTPHDAADSVGYNLFVLGKKLSVATDMGHIEQTVLEALDGSDMLLLEANHDIEMLRNGRYPAFLKKRILSDVGHLSNEGAGQIALRLAERGTRAILLGHLSSENNYPQLAYQVVSDIIQRAGLAVGGDVRLAVAQRYSVSGAF